ncbi:MAG: Mth938-like domain-containing protein [Gammaproteobacteria bacterium]|nr:Mth938-like domain-containing protein [Gammaproteobacteria bacterium]
MPPRPSSTATPQGTEIRRETFNGNLIVMPEALIRDWQLPPVEDLQPADFDLLLPYDLEVILLGTGPRQRWPAPGLLDVMRQRNIGFEVMDTGAACRTYNILMADQRRVAAALIVAAS